jgi:predicted porin
MLKMKLKNAKYMAALTTGVSLLMSGANVVASEVTLYGTVDAALVYTSNMGEDVRTYLRSGNLNAGKFGLMGSEDLGPGFKAIFKLENGHDLMNGSNGGLMFNRQAFVGISSDKLGTITAGLQNTPYAKYVGGLGPTGALTGATGAHPGDLDSLDLTLRLGHSITYTSPVINGFEVGAQYGFSSTNQNQQRDQDAYSVGMRFEEGPFSVAAGYYGLKTPKVGGPIYTIANNAPINSGYQSAAKNNTFGIAARYTVKEKYMVGLNYTNVQYLPGDDSLFDERAIFNTVGVIGSYQYSPNVLLAAGYSMTQLNNSNGISDAARYHQFALEQLYTVTKRTAFYMVQAYQTSSGQNLQLSGNSLAIVDAVASVGNSQNSTPSSGPAQFVAMFGVRHNF